jgi:serine O-acetyltransferase
MNERDLIMADAVRFICDSEGWVNAEKYETKKPNPIRIFRFFIINSGFRGVYFYRKRHHHKVAKHRFRYRIWAFLNFALNKSMIIDVDADIGPGLLVRHATGIVIGGAKMGINCTIYQNVTIGANFRRNEKGEHNPTIEDNVIFSPGAVVIGPIKVGSNTLIGANTVLTRSLDGGNVVSGSYATIIGMYDKSRFG